jgi:hypothetical protein
LETIAKLPFSNFQLEFLKLYESGVSDDDLKAINQLIVNYLANKVQDNADLQWEEKGFSNLLMDECLSKDLRK